MSTITTFSCGHTATTYPSPYPHLTLHPPNPHLPLSASQTSSSHHSHPSHPPTSYPFPCRACHRNLAYEKESAIRAHYQPRIADLADRVQRGLSIVRGNGEDEYRGGLWEGIRKMQREEGRLMGRMEGKVRGGGCWGGFWERWG